jgi:3'-phosphoadenosine 5'-phosphosulfate sulfotransferase (PAPS reductase)/FAD synthetase
MLDIMEQFARGKYTPIFLYIVPGLEFQEKTLRYYEARYGIEIKREAHWDISAYLKQAGKGTKVLRAGDTEQYLRKKYDCPWIALGYRKDESLQRRGHLGGLAKTSYIDHEYKKIFPVADWLESDMKAWVKTKKLLLPPEYSRGFRNIDQFKGPAASYIATQYPEDWQRIITAFPLVESELYRGENGRE